jgi:hypothetical protein
VPYLLFQVVTALQSAMARPDCGCGPPTVDHLRGPFTFVQAPSPEPVIAPASLARRAGDDTAGVEDTEENSSSIRIAGVRGRCQEGVAAGVNEKRLRVGTPGHAQLVGKDPFAGARRPVSRVSWRLPHLESVVGLPTPVEARDRVPGDGPASPAGAPGLLGQSGELGDFQLAVRK